MSETTLQLATLPRLLTRTQGGLDYFYGFVDTVDPPVDGNVDNLVWRAGVACDLQQRHQVLGQPVQNLQIISVKKIVDGVAVLAHHDQVLKGFSERTRGTQAGRKHRPQQVPNGMIFVSKHRWVVPALRLSLDAA